MMIWRRWATLGVFSLAVSLIPGRAAAQPAPTADASAGFAGANSSGGYSASVPMDLPAARGGLPVPVQIVHGEHGVGAVGPGWDVPLSYIRRDTTIVRRRPIGTANVAPQAREQLSLVLEGNRVDLVRRANEWAARRDAPDLRVRDQGNGTWVMYDGQGRTYLFATSTALAGTGMWLLQDVSGAGGSKVHLDYSITASTLGGSAAVSIDLIRASYNPHPTTAGCYKTVVDLLYDGNQAAPLSVSPLGTTMLVRQHVLGTIDLSSKESCGVAGVRLRRYQFFYQPDPDTRRPRLQSVQLQGQVGTPEGNTPITIASYAYGTASIGDRLQYQQTQSLPIDNLGHTISSPAARPGFGTGFSTDGSLIDVTGDGRPDHVSFSEAGMLSVRRNASAINAVSFSSAATLSDGTLSPRAVATSTTQPGFDDPLGDSPELVAPSYDRVWRQIIDVNGDGRIDIIDAAEQAGHWVVYLNTPDPVDPAHVLWQRRSYSIASLAQQLTARGLFNGDAYLPLARRATGGYGDVATCWAWVEGDIWVRKNRGIGWCAPTLPPFEKQTITEWEVKDINGDGYPDVVFNSSRAIIEVWTVGDGRQRPDPVPGVGGVTAVVVDRHMLTPESDSNKIEAVFNILGTRLTDGDDAPFSAPVTLGSDQCGIDQWFPDTPTSQHLECDIVDVNGDGIVDRVKGTAVFLGTGNTAAGSFFTSNAMLTLPGPLAVQESNRGVACGAGSTFNTLFRTTQAAALRDVSGDGIPDYVARYDANNWNVSIGTGTGFVIPIPIIGRFSVSENEANCGGTRSKTISGLFDIDGDGRADVLADGNAYLLVGVGGSLGVPDAGRLTQIDNGYGAKTNIHYRSAKGDGGVHQVPYPEIVVDSVDTTATQGFGGSLSATRHAYGGAELLFDPTRDAFVFPGYRRSLVLQTPVAQPAGVATIVVTDAYEPVSAVDPYGIAAGSANAVERYRRSLRIGRTRDVTVLSGAFGVSAITTPSLLLGIDVGSDSHRISGTHYEWGARLFASNSDPPGPEPCSEMVFPYDRAGSTAFDAIPDHYDACTARGFAYAMSVQSWRGAPGAAPPATANVENRSEVTTIDDFGRIVAARHLNDTHRNDDDLCVETVYATPTGSNQRVLSAAAKRTISDCASTTYVKDSWDYDQLANGSVSTGLLTSHTVERRDDTGALLGTIRQFDATYDANANATSITTTREGGATRSVTVAYDPFGLALVSLTTSATSVPTTQVAVTLDPVTLNALTTTDPNGTVHIAKFDGFDRPVLSKVKPPGGTEGVLSKATYLGFTGGDSLGRRIVQKVFTDPVAPGTEDTAVGRTSTVYLDELGRGRYTELALGASYSNQTLIAGRRTYDSLGRVVFEADPYPSTQTFTTAYGTTRFFNADGTPSCVVRGAGQQTTVPTATNEGQELYPTCFERMFQDNTEVVSVRDAASFLTNSPQEGVTHTSYATATGRLIARSTWKGSSRLEHATFAHDRLGHMTAMTRYQDAIGGTKPVTSSWRYDSLGQLLELDEPDSVPRFNTYSNWGELLEVRRGPVNAPTAVIATTYDALGRVIHREQRANGTVDPETVNDYQYDQAVNVAPQVTPTNILGRLALATSPTGSVSVSYDSFGQVNARVFTDHQGGLYVEKHTFHADGSPDTLDLLLPDTAYAPEHVAYQYDSAGRGTSVKYTSGGATKDLYTASTIDPFGRVRQATYGQATYTASYADVGRRLLNQVTVSSMLGSRSIAFQSYDPVGRERSRVETRNGANTATAMHFYDALGRLSSSVNTTAAPPGGPDPGGPDPGTCAGCEDPGTTTVFNQQFTYDPLGNILGISDAPSGAAPTTTILSYLDTDRDRICRITYGSSTGTACNVTYDEVGSITSQPTPTGTRDYNYLPDGSVRTITDDHGSQAHFRYGAFGEVQELDLATSAPPFVPDERKDRHYGSLITQRYETVGAAKNWVLLRRIPGPDGFLATRHGPTGPWTFTFGEARGNRFFTDQNGAFVQDVDYHPFGKATSTGAQPGSQLYSTGQWNGGDALAAFGISQLGARLYDPAIGRFISRDPLLIPRTSATTNPYAFADNDPVNGSDPSGLDVLCGKDMPKCHPENSGAYVFGSMRGLPPYEPDTGGPSPVYPPSSGPSGPRDDGPKRQPGNPGGGRPSAPPVDASQAEALRQAAANAELASQIRALRLPDDLPSVRVPVLDGSSERWQQAKIRGAIGLMALAVVSNPSQAFSFLLGCLGSGGCPLLEVFQEGEGVAPSGFSDGDPPDLPRPYKRPSYATTRAQRESVQGRPCVDCGATTSRQVADHRRPLVKEYYEDGGIDKARMRSVDAVQPQCPTCSASQGGKLSWYSRAMRFLRGQ